MNPPTTGSGKALQLVACAISAALMLLVMAVWLGGQLRPAELAIYDSRFQWRGPRTAPQDIVIVTVDDRSLDLLGVETGSQTRRHFAAMLWKRGSPSDRDQARELADLAAATYQDLGIEGPGGAPDGDLGS